MPDFSRGAGLIREPFVGLPLLFFIPEDRVFFRAGLLADGSSRPPEPSRPSRQGQWRAPFRERMYGSWSRRVGGIRLQWRGPRRFFTGFPLSAVALQRERRHLESAYIIPCPGRMKAISGFPIDPPAPLVSLLRVRLDARRKPLESNDLSADGWSWPVVERACRDTARSGTKAVRLNFGFDAQRLPERIEIRFFNGQTGQVPWIATPTVTLP